MSSKRNKDEYGKFASKGLDSSTVKPTLVRFPPDVDTVLRTMDNKAEYVRKAVLAKLQQDGLI